MKSGHFLRQKTVKMWYWRIALRISRAKQISDKEVLGKTDTQESVLNTIIGMGERSVLDILFNKE